MSAQLKIHRTQPATTSLSKPSPYFSEGLYIDPEIVADLVFSADKTSVYYFEFKASAPKDFSFWMDSRVRTLKYSMVQVAPSEDIYTLAEKLCEEHQSISTYEGIFGGIPHMAGLRISVADILEQLYLTGSIAAVQDIYSPDLSEDQIKEAIAYAQDFLESALSSRS